MYASWQVFWKALYLVLLICDLLPILSGLSFFINWAQFFIKSAKNGSFLSVWLYRNNEKYTPLPPNTLSPLRYSLPCQIFPIRQSLPPAAPKSSSTLSLSANPSLFWSLHLCQSLPHGSLSSSDATSLFWSLHFCRSLTFYHSLFLWAALLPFSDLLYRGVYYFLQIKL